MNAKAVQMTPSATRAPSARPDGTWCGQVTMAGGSQTSAPRLRQAAVIGRAGTSASFLAAISGAVAYPSATSSTSTTATALPPLRSGAASTATPARPMTRPAQRRGLSRSVPPVSRAVTTLMIGTAAISRPASELGSFRSASESRPQGMMISSAANATSGRQCRRSTSNSPPP